MQGRILQELAEIKQLLLAQNANQKEVLTLAETVEFLGVSKSYVYKMTCSRQIPCYCPTGKILYFRRSELLEWLEKSKLKSESEIAQRSLSRLVLSNRSLDHSNK